MNLGLDLRGGVHFLYRWTSRAPSSSCSTSIRARLPLAAARASASRSPASRRRQVDTRGHRRCASRDGCATRGRAPRSAGRTPNLVVATRRGRRRGASRVKLKPAAASRERQDFAIQQNITTLRNRVNELGVAEPIVQRQGADRIVVQLPGVQDSAEAKDILGARDPRVPPGRRPERRRSRPSGRAARRSARSSTRSATAARCCSSARSSSPATSSPTRARIRQGEPAVYVRLERAAAREMLETTRDEPRQADGRGVHREEALTEKRNGAACVGTNARQGREGHQRRDHPRRVRQQLPDHRPHAGEARDSRCCCAPARWPRRCTSSRSAPSARASARTTSTRAAARSLIGMLRRCSSSWSLYYQLFGMVATWCCWPTWCCSWRLLSMLQATLTLPGIAGIVLTVGMAVDANVLIYERIREELRNGATPQARSARATRRRSRPSSTRTSRR